MRLVTISQARLASAEAALTLILAVPGVHLKKAAQYVLIRLLLQCDEAVIVPQVLIYGILSEGLDTC